MGFLRTQYSFNRWRFEAVFLAFGMLWGLVFLGAALLYLAFPTPWVGVATVCLACLLIASFVAVSFEKRGDAR